MGFTLKNPPANGNIMLNKAHFFTTKKDKNHTIEQKKKKKKHPFLKKSVQLSLCKYDTIITNIRPTIYFSCHHFAQDIQVETLFKIC